MSRTRAAAKAATRAAQAAPLRPPAPLAWLTLALTLALVFLPSVRAAAISPTDHPGHSTTHAHGSKAGAKDEHKAKNTQKAKKTQKAHDRTARERAKAKEKTEQAARKAARAAEKAAREAARAAEKAAREAARAAEKAAREAARAAAKATEHATEHASPPPSQVAPVPQVMSPPTTGRPVRPGSPSATTAPAAAGPAGSPSTRGDTPAAGPAVLPLRPAAGGTSGEGPAAPLLRQAPMDSVSLSGGGADAPARPEPTAATRPAAKELPFALPGADTGPLLGVDAALLLAAVVTVVALGVGSMVVGAGRRSH